MFIYSISKKNFIPYILVPEVGYRYREVLLYLVYTISSMNVYYFTDQRLKSYTQNQKDIGKSIKIN